MSEPSDFAKLDADKQLGIDAHVDRTDPKGDNMQRANMAIGDIAGFIKNECGINNLKLMNYHGSAAIHIFHHELLGFQYVCQVATLGKVNEYSADKAFTQLQNAMKARYGRKVGSKRSGL